MKQIPLLTAHDIEVKVKQCSEKGAVALLYKTARVDMAILDEVFGAENWECDYKEIKGNLYCGIGVRTNDTMAWKWDCGIESREDNEGNQKKGEASDAFKRAGTKWGIGRELYTSPFVFIKVPTVKDGARWKLENAFERFDCADIGYDDNRRINRLVIVDSKGNEVYSYSSKASNCGGKQPVCHETSKVENKVEDKQIVPPNANKLVCPVCGQAIRKFIKKDGTVIEPQEVLDKVGMCIPCYLASNKEQK